MKSFTILLLSIILVSCSTPEKENNRVKIEEQGISILLPDGWSFDGDDLVDNVGDRKGEFELGVVVPSPYIDCQEFSNRYMNGGKDMETDKGGYGFNQEGGGDVFIENDKLDVVTINGKKLFRVSSDVTSYSEEFGNVKGSRCGYCVELSKNKLGLFAFYPDSENEVGLADTIMASMELLK
jgi:hypothetical protein